MALSDAIREARLLLGRDEATAGQAAVLAAWEVAARDLEMLVEGERLKRRETFRQGVRPRRCLPFGRRGREDRP